MGTYRKSTIKPSQVLLQFIFEVSLIMELLCPGSYFNAGDLEGRCEHVTVKFKREVSPQLLQLLQNNALVDENTNEFLANAPNVPEGTQVKIPFRFAEVLLRKEIIEILPPKAFKRQTREKK